MGKVLTPEQADSIVPRKTRKRVSRQARIEERENEALEQLRALGFRTTLHDLPKIVEGDELLATTESHFVPGNCYAVMYAVDGKRKHVSGISAVDALSQARTWWDFQQRLKDDSPQRFVPSAEFTPEARVSQSPAGDARTTKIRRANTERRVLSLEGTPHLVDAHGDPAPSDGSQASQYRNA
jgi:hypothetical protein